MAILLSTLKASALSLAGCMYAIIETSETFSIANLSGFKISTLAINLLHVPYHSHLDYYSESLNYDIYNINMDITFEIHMNFFVHIRMPLQLKKRISW